MTRRGLAGAAAGAAVLAFSGCRAQSAGSAGPQTRNPHVTVTFPAYWHGGSTSPAALRNAMRETLAPFYHDNPDIDVQIVTYGTGQLPLQTILTDLIAGVSTDIVCTNDFAPFQNTNFLLPLEPYMKRDNVDPSIWNARQFGSYQGPAGAAAVPCYTGTMVYFLNLADFDLAGLSYPDAGWTHADFSKIAAQLARPAQGHYGAAFPFQTWGPYQASFVFHGFGGRQVYPRSPVSRLSQPPDVNVLNWLYQDLFWTRACAPWSEPPAGPLQGFPTGLVSMAMVGTWMLFGVLSGTWSIRKLAILPFPIFPTGRTTFSNSDFYAINAATAHPEQTWRLLRWISVEPNWSRAMIRLILLSPALNALWAEWEQVVRQVAPPLQGTALQWYEDGVRGKYAYPVEYYPQDDATVGQITQPYYTKLFNRQYGSVEEGARQIDQLINTFEATRNSGAAANAVVQRAFPAEGPPIAEVVPGV